MSDITLLSILFGSLCVAAAAVASIPWTARSADELEQAIRLTGRLMGRAHHRAAQHARSTAGEIAGQFAAGAEAGSMADAPCT